MLFVLASCCKLLYKRLKKLRLSNLMVPGHVSSRVNSKMVIQSWERKIPRNAFSGPFFSFIFGSSEFEVSKSSKYKIGSRF